MTAAATSETEHVALAKFVNEVCFLKQTKTLTTPPMKCEAKVHQENEGRIKMATDGSGSRRARHIDVKHHEVRDAVDEGVVRQVKSEK